MGPILGSSKSQIANRKSHVAKDLLARRAASSEQLTANQGVVVSVNTSSKTGVPKKPVDQIRVLADHGFKGDAHAGDWHRQVSLLAQESINKISRRGLNVSPGDFAENITTRGVNLCSLPVGFHLRLGGEVLLEISQIGKVCHQRCAIYYQAGDCVMPREGIFAKVLKGGKIKVGDKIVVRKLEKMK